MAHEWKGGAVGLGLALLAACGGAPDAAPGPAAERIDSAGVEIVTSPGVDRALPWRLEVVEEIAGGEGDTLLQADWRRIRLGAAGDGQLWIGDLSFGSERLFRMDRESGALVPAGRKGGGPGEFQMPARLVVTAAGEAALLDWGKRALVRFGPDGTPLPEVRWDGLGEGFAQDFALPRAGLVLQLVTGLDTLGRLQRLVLAGADTTELARLAEPPGRMVMYESCAIGMALPPLFTPELAWTARDDAVAWSTGAGYTVSLWRDGRVVRSIRRDLPPRPATRELATQELGEGQKVVVGGRPPCTIDPDEIMEKRGYLPEIPTVSRLALGSDGSLWVERRVVTGETSLLDVFDSTGTYAGTVSGSFPWPQAWLPGGDFVAVIADSLELPLVRRFRVVRDGG